MEVIDIYNSFDIKQKQRIGRNAKIIYNFGRYGSRGTAKINPATVYIDAVVSVGEATIAYLNYRKAKEKTVQLQINLDSLKHTYSKQKDLLNQQYKNYTKELAMNTDVLKKELENEKNKWDEKFKPIYEQSKNYLHLLNNELIEMRKIDLNSKELIKLENKYREAINASLTITIQTIGG